MLLLDALENAPTLYVVLTAREFLTRSACTDHLSKLRRSLRRRWPSVEWAVTVEFQPGRWALHLNLMVKGVPVDDVDEFRAHVCRLWCSRVDAESFGQYVGVVADEVGVVRYISSHFLKESQAPKLGWKGHRYSCTRGYLVRPASVMRREARAALQLKRALYRAEADGLRGTEALIVAEHAVLRASQVSWECVVLTIDSATGEIVRARPLNGGGVTIAMRSDRPAARRQRDAYVYGVTERALCEIRVGALESG